MAQAIPLIAQIAASAWASSAGLGALGTALISGAATLAGAYVASELMGKDAGSQTDDADSIRNNIVSTSRTIPLIYGERLVGSNDVFVEVGKVGNGTPSTKHHFMWVVHVLGEGEIEGLSQIEHDGITYDEIYIDGEPLWKFDFDHTAPQGSYDVSYWILNGTDSQTCPTAITDGTRINKQTDDKYTDNLRNTAYIVFRFLYKGSNAHRFTGVPKREVVVKGLKCIDPRVSPTVKYWTQNPALILYDYLTNTRYGMGWDTSLIDTGSVQSAATYCDDEGWALNYVCASQLKSQSIVDTILGHYRGFLKHREGQVYFGYSEHIVVSEKINDQHIARDASGHPVVAINQPSHFNTPDAAIVSYINKDEKWTSDRVTIGNIQSASDYLKPIDFIGYTDKSLALNMGYYTLERERLNRAMSMTLRPDTVRFEVNDIVEISSSELAIGNQPMRIRSYSVAQDGLVSITAVWENEEMYDDHYNPIEEKTYNVDLPGPMTPPPSVYILGVTEEAYTIRERSFIRLLVEFEPPDIYPWFAHVEVWVSLEDDAEPSEESFEQRFLATDTFLIDPVEEGQWYTIRLNAVSTFGMRQTNQEAPKIGYRVIGKSLVDPPCFGYPPSISVEKASVDIIGYFDRSHDLYKFPDLAGYEFREGESWLDAVFVAFKAGPSLSISAVRPGTHRFWLSTKHKNGRYCVPGSSDYVEATIEDPPPGTYYFNSGTVDYSTGTKTNITYATTPDRIYVTSGTTGTYTSVAIDTGNESVDEGMVVYLDFDFEVDHPGGTWNDNNATTTTWNAINATTVTWNDFLREEYELEAPVLKASVLYADNPSMTSYKVADRMELVSALVFGRYIQVKFELTDLPNSKITVYAATWKAAYLERPALIAV